MAKAKAKASEAPPATADDQAAAQVTERLEYLRTEDVLPTRENPRRPREDDPAVAELAESIRSKGLIQPVVVRPHPTEPGKYDLRAGHRRLLAHRLLGRETILAIVRDLSDDQALEVTVLENLQRQDLSPLEEARGVQSLLGSGRSAAEVGRGIGKSPRWVRNRALLTDLAEPWPTWFESQEMPARGRATAEELALTVRHLELLAQFPREVQERLATVCEQEPWRIMAGHWDQFREWCAAQQGRLMAAPWSLDSVLLPGGACAVCTSRSRRRQQWLFAPEGGEPPAGLDQDVCLDLVCWRRKEEAWLNIELVRLRLEYPNVIEVRTAHPPYVTGKPTRLHGLPLVGKDDWSEARLVKQDAPLAQPALVAYGPGLGKLVWVVLQRRGGAGGQAKAGPKSLAERRAELGLRRRARAVELFATWLETEEARDAFAVLPVHGAYAVVLAIGCSGETDYREAEGWKAYWSLLAESPATVREDPLGVFQAGPLWDRVRPTLAERLRVLGLVDVDPERSRHDAHAEMVAQCRMLQIEARQWDGSAEAELPEPKIWAKLEVL